MRSKNIFSKTIKNKQHFSGFKDFNIFSIFTVAKNEYTFPHTHFSSIPKSTYQKIINFDKIYKDKPSLKNVGKATKSTLSKKIQTSNFSYEKRLFSTDATEKDVPRIVPQSKLESRYVVGINFCLTPIKKFDTELYEAARALIYNMCNIARDVNNIDASDVFSYSRTVTRAENIDESEESWENTLEKLFNESKIKIGFDGDNFFAQIGSEFAIEKGYTEKQVQDIETSIRNVNIMNRRYNKVVWDIEYNLAFPYYPDSKDLTSFRLTFSGIETPVKIMTAEERKKKIFSIDELDEKVLKELTIIDKLPSLSDCEYTVKHLAEKTNELHQWILKYQQHESLKILAKKRPFFDDLMDVVGWWNGLRHYFNENKICLTCSQIILLKKVEYLIQEACAVKKLSDDKYPTLEPHQEKCVLSSTPVINYT